LSAVPAGGAFPSREQEDGMSMHHEHREVTGGVDTHADEHVAAVVDETGRILGTRSFPATGAGYRQLLRWLRGHGKVVRVGIEGTGSYGAGLSRFLSSEDLEIVEVNRPNRQTRRRRGKSDTVDAEAAARAALNGEADGAPKRGDGPVEAIRMLQLTRRSAVKARTQASNQIDSLIINAPDELRARLRDVDTKQRINICSRFRPGPVTDTTAAAKTALRSLAQRHLALGNEIVMLDEQLRALCVAANPALLGARGVGTEVAATLLVTAGDNPHRMRSEAAFAALCGASPVEASSGKTVRHRVNHGGDRQANNALWRIVMVRLTCCERTKRYAAARRTEGKTTREIIRCLKRYVAREIYQLLTHPPAVLLGADLREQRTAAGLTLDQAASALSTWPIRISRLERSLDHDTHLAERYHDWLNQQNEVALTA
jgi:transposase